jgi:polyisoprenoid-binding protein YceI
MKRFALVTAIFILAAHFAFAQASTWVSDPNHSEVDFAITHMSIDKVHGRFGNVNATVQYDPADVTKSTVNVTIDVTTVDTGVQARDNDLKTANYFDVAKYPQATFTSTSVAGNGSHLTVNGNLTLKGVTKPVVLDVDTISQPVTVRGKVHTGFSATATIHRTDFGIAPSAPSAMLGDEVQLTIELDAVK